LNSLFKKFLLYNIISVGLIAGIVSFTLQVSQKNLIDEKVQQVSSHTSSVDKYLSQYSYNKNIENNKSIIIIGIAPIKILVLLSLIIF